MVSRHTHYYECKPARITTLLHYTSSQNISPNLEYFIKIMLMLICKPLVEHGYNFLRNTGIIGMETLLYVVKEYFVEKGTLITMVHNKSLYVKL